MRARPNFLCVTFPAAIATAFLLHSPLLAQLPTTLLNAVTPPGAQQGATVEVSVSGVNIDMAEQLIFSHPGIKAEPKQTTPNEFVDPRPAPGAYTVTVAADVPPGVYEARLQGKYGVSNPRLFVVGAHEEISDNNANRSFESAQELPLNTVVNGKVEGNQSDYYKVALKKGQRILVDCQAWRIDSRLDPVVTVFNLEGEPLAESHDYAVRDSFIDFTADADGEVLIGVRDFLYGGGGEHYYRLRVHSQPHVDFAIPNAVAAGQTADVTLYGRNLPGGQPSEWTTKQGAKLDKLTVKVTAPASPALEPQGYATLESARLMTFTHQQGQLRTELYIARAPGVVTEATENESPEAAMEIPAPTEVVGQFYPAADVDWYQFEAKEGDVFWIEIISHQLGLSTDPNFVLQRIDKNDKGEEQVKEVAFVDDPGDRNSRVNTDFDTSTDDPSYRLAVPSDGVYRIRVTDQFGGSRVDPRMQYRLVVRNESPDIRATAFAKEFKVANNNQVPQFAPTLRRGGALPIMIRVDRLDGFDGEVTVRAEGLPPSITCPEAILGPEQTTAHLIFTAAADAQPWSGPVHIVAEAQIGDEKVARLAPVGAVVWGTTNRTQTPATFRLLHDFHLSVTAEEDPATVVVGDGAILETSLGGAVEAPVTVTRRAGHAEALKLTAVDVPKEFKPGDITIAKDKTEGKLAISVKNNAKPGIYTFHLRSDSKVKYAAKTEVVAAAEADQKKLEAAVKTTAEAVKQSTEKVNKAKAEATKAKGEQTKAEAEVKKAEAAKQQAETAAKQAKEAEQKATEAAAAKPDDAGLKEAAEAAKKAAAEAQAKLDEQLKALTQAEEAAKQAVEQAKATAEAQTAAEAELKAAQDKAKRATDAKKAADTAVANAKKAAAAKDVNIAVISTPIRLRIVPTPIAVSATAAQELTAEGKVSIPVKLEKKYGFDENVDISVSFPKGVSGLTAGKLQIAKGKSEGMLELTANKSPTAGTHAVQVVAKGKFNNVNIQAETAVDVTVKPSE